MAKRTNSFSSKGELDLSQGVIFEVKKESVDTIPFFDILKEFDGKIVSISIVENIEIAGIDVEKEYEDEE
jgi:predicted RNA-binding protein